MKRGRGTKLMAVADGHGLPIAADGDIASPTEVTLIGATLDARFAEEIAEPFIGDKTYDGYTIAEVGIELIVAHRSNRKVKTQDGRRPRRSRQSWKIKRLFAWLYNSRRLATRNEHIVANFLGFVQLACIIILLHRCS